MEKRKGRKDTLQQEYKEKIWCLDGHYRSEMFPIHRRHFTVSCLNNKKWLFFAATTTLLFRMNQVV